VAGATFFTEYTTAFALFLISLYIVVFSKHRLKMFYLVAGSSILAICFFTYNKMIFGSPFSLGYSNLASQGFAAVHKKGLFGISTPSISALKSLTFSFRIGLLTLSPFLVFSVIGIYKAFRNKSIELLLIFTIVLIHFYLISSFGVWDGGWSFGARHMVAAIPFIFLLSFHGLTYIKSKSANTVFAVLSIFSLALFTAVNYMFPFAAVDQLNPLSNYFLIAFREDYFPFSSVFSLVVRMQGQGVYRICLTF